MENEAKEPTGVTRGQNAVHVMPLDWSAAERVLATMIDRIDPARPDTQLLVVTADAESAAAAADALVHAVGDRAVRVVAATSSPRASRLLRIAPSHVVAGASDSRKMTQTTTARFGGPFVIVGAAQSRGCDPAARFSC